MENVKILVSALTLMTPAIVGAVCVVLTGFSLRDCLKPEERKLNTIVIVYLASNTFGWIATFGYYFMKEELFVVLNVPMFAAYLLAVILLYRIFRFMTRQGLPEDFPLVHYVAPGLIVATFAVWMLFVPMETQVEIVRSRQMWIPGKYEAYSRFFTSKPLVRLAFQLVYFIFIGRLLTGYFRKMRHIDNQVRKPARWVVFLIALLLISVFSSVVASFSPRASIFAYQWVLYASIGASGLYVLLAYHIIRRQYLLYTVYPVKRKQTVTEGGYRKFYGRLTHERLETYFREQKPYLNAEYKISDLMEAMDVNRNAASSFINKTYGVNFNQYVNRWRVDELKRLLSLPGNEKQSAAGLYQQAGFGELKQYYRAAGRREHD